MRFWGSCADRKVRTFMRGSLLLDVLNLSSVCSSSSSFFFSFVGTPPRLYLLISAGNARYVVVLISAKEKGGIGLRVSVVHVKNRQL